LAVRLPLTLPHPSPPLDYTSPMVRISTSYFLLQVMN
jgi:hypothetical protein